MALTLPEGCKIRPVWFIFSHTSQLIKITFDVALEQFKLNVDASLE